jgi:hypothetical protein
MQAMGIARDSTRASRAARRAARGTRRAGMSYGEAVTQPFTPPRGIYRP